MFNYICSALMSFRGIFSRKSTWVIFCMLIMGFIGSTEMIGVTSFCRFWGGSAALYNSFLHFFRASSWSMPALLAQWGTFVLSQNVAIHVQGRLLMFGDHTYVPKDGRRMPGVISMHQHSETQTKPSYFRAHCWGAIALGVGSMSAPYCLPLALAIHLGMLCITRQKQRKKIGKDFKSMGARIVQMSIDFALRHDVPCILVLDAFFPTGAVFKLAASVWSVDMKQPLVTLLVRAKKNCVAYLEPEPSSKKGAGRPRKYGEKVKIMELFDHTWLFSKVTCRVYGRTEEILIASFNLLWKPFGDKLLFVLAVTSRGPLVLMSSDLNLDPISAIELYCLRYRIEIMFDMLKNLMGVFNYRFWSKKMPANSRTPKKNKSLKVPADQDISSVKTCWEACERFVMTGAIALGLMILIGLKFTDKVWEQFDGYLRTRSRHLPSERTVKYVMGPLILRNFLISAPIGIMREIRDRFFNKKIY